jgi:threonine/homoserine/homoserine lactone efflux protein
MMALPYWFAYCGWLKVSGWWPESPFSVFFFSVGVGIGTFSALALYAWAAQRVVERSAEIARYINRIIALIFFLLACKIIVNLYGQMSSH